MSKICPKCNHVNPDYAQFCTECGSPLETEGFSLRRTEETDVVVPKSDKGTKNKNTILFVLLAIVIIFGGIFTYQYFTVDFSENKTIPATNEVLCNLPGNYTLREFINGETIGKSKTAVLKKDNSRYMFTIVTDFGPEHHSFINTSDNKLYSETLGEGEVTYKEIINKITITFKKENYIWEFVK